MRDMFGGFGGQEEQADAQDLAYDAMEADDAETALGLAVEALELDPHCLDALTLIAQAQCADRKKLIRRMCSIVEIGERELGEEFFGENRGHFWGIIETRPYMRARAYLAELLMKTGRHAEAIEQHEELLQLNPGDNQGLRYSLMGCYLLQENLDGARRLFEEYEEECSAIFAWALVLERYLSGHLPEASAALKEARSVNQHVEAYLTGLKRVPQRLPDYYGIGDVNEAIICADALKPAWARCPQAIRWLKKQHVALP